MASPIVQISTLTKSFGSIKAVDGLNLEIYPHSVFGFLGPNGAGKSTSLRMLLSLIRPDSGSIRIFNRDLRTHRSEIMKRIGCIVEKPDFYLYLSAFENLRMLARWSGAKPGRDQLYDMLRFVGLTGRENDAVKTFSHGMKQRLGLAQALIHDPELIVLDEPTTGLDPQGIIDLRNLILKLKQEKGKTVILSSHILSEIELIADDMVIINKGKAITQGRVNDLLSDQDLIVYVESGDSELAERLIRVSYPNVRVTQLGNQTLSCSMSREALPALQKMFASTTLSVYAIYYKRRLEEYFLKLTSE